MYLSRKHLVRNIRFSNAIVGLLMSRVLIRVSIYTIDLDSRLDLTVYIKVPTGHACQSLGSSVAVCQLTVCR